jgi:hypothetical protein
MTDSQADRTVEAGGGGWSAVAGKAIRAVTGDGDDGARGGGAWARAK